MASVWFTLFRIVENINILEDLLLSKPTKLTSCKVKLNDGREIDLTSLDKPNQPRTITSATNFDYFYNPCKFIQFIQ